MNWNTLKALNEIFAQGRTRRTESFSSDPVVQHLIYSTKELYEDGGLVRKGKDFDIYYSRYHLKNFELYLHFLVEKNLLKPQTRFQESDIKILMDIDQRVRCGDLNPLREQIIQSGESVRGISLMFFKNEKYLDGRESLINGLKVVLQVSDFADDRDQQYKYVLDCDSPKCIVLCENIDFLKKPTLPRKNNIELWYAGGKNIAKLQYADTRGLPIYYSCDWDYDGLLIYGMVKEKISSIELLLPTGSMKNISATEHDSHWKDNQHPENLSGLPKELFDEPRRKLITQLIVNDAWVIEESNDLLTMIKRKIGL